MKDNYIYIINLDGEIVTQSGKRFEIMLGSLCDLEADDWEIVKEIKKVKLRDLTEKEYREYEKGCIKRICARCPFHDVKCNLKYDDCWVKHKDLYSDNFLNQ